jgi:tetratricopeptide (TPR) repeat protein
MMNLWREKKRIERLTRDGVRKFGSDDYESAWKAFEEVLFLEEDNPVANTLGGASLLNLGRIDRAESLVRNGVRLTPHLALAHYYLAVLLSTQEKYDEAAFEVWEAIAIEPHNAGYLLLLGRLLFIQSREAEACEQLRRYIQFNAESAEAHFLLGLSLMRCGQISDAKDELEITLFLQPDNDGSLTLDGLLCMAKADDLLSTPPKLAGYRHAAILLRRAIELNPNNELAVEWLRIAETTIERISRPTEPPPPPEKWYKTASKQLLVWVGLAAASITMLGVMAWLDESGFADFWLMALCILIFDLLAFGVMSYLRKDFSALPPSIVRFVERVGAREISPIDTRAKG